MVTYAAALTCSAARQDQDEKSQDIKAVWIQAPDLHLHDMHHLWFQNQTEILHLSECKIHFRSSTEVSLGFEIALPASRPVLHRH